MWLDTQSALERDLSERIAIFLVATGPYRRFLAGSLGMLWRRLFVGHERLVYLLTDEADVDLAGVSAFHIPHLGWPHNTLFRYHYMRHLRNELAAVDVVVYIDVDMEVLTEVRLAEVISAQVKYFGVQHPLFGPGEGTFETNPASTAWVDRSVVDTTNYWQACFWGGWSGPVVDMVDVLADRVAADLANGVVATWHDESHLNRFFVENKASVRTLDPGFAFPEKKAFGYVQRIRHASKPHDEFPCLPGPPTELVRNPPVPRRLTSAEPGGRARGRSGRLADRAP